MPNERSPKIGVLCSGVTATGAQAQAGPAGAGEKTFHGSVLGSGSVTATIVIEVNNDPSIHPWITLGTITLSGTAPQSDGFSSQASWAYYRANITALTGTGAAVTVTVCQE